MKPLRKIHLFVLLLTLLTLFVFSGCSMVATVDGTDRTDDAASDEAAIVSAEGFDLNGATLSASVPNATDSLSFPDRIRVSETSPRKLSEDDKLRWWLDGTTLRIRYAKSGIRLFSANLEKTLTVSLPKGTVLKNAGIHATSADLNIRELSAEEIALDTSSGDISAAVTAKKLKASSTSGDMKISQEEDLDTATLDSTSGNIGASFGSAKEIAVTTTSGGAGVTVTGAADRVKAHSTSGNVYLDLAEAGTAEASSTSGSVSFKAGRIGTLKIDSTSGDVTACLPEDPGFRCEISTTSGDISSDLAVKQEGSVYTCGDESAKCRISTTSGDVRLAK